MNNIEIATKIAWSLLGTPYIWAGDDPIAGFDCSGLVVEILKSVGKFPREGDWTAQGLFHLFENTFTLADAKEGMLVFWHTSNDTGRIVHVEYCLNDKLSIGASGGGSHNLTIQDAIDKNAFVKIRPFRTRPYLYGFTDPFMEDRQPLTKRRIK